MIISVLSTTGLEPQELDLLGSVSSNQSCIVFGGWMTRLAYISIRYGDPKIALPWLTEITMGKNRVDPISPWYRSPVTQCNSYIHYSINASASAKILLPGIFLICGDQAWPGIPSNAWGGPCYLGKISMFTPQY